MKRRIISLLTAAATIAPTLSVAPTQAAPRAAVTATNDINSDIKTANKLVIGEALYNAQQSRNTDYIYAMQKLASAKNERQVQNYIKEAFHGDIRPVPGDRAIGEMIKTGLGYFTSPTGASIGGAVIDKTLDFQDWVNQPAEKLSQAPKDVAMAAFIGNFDRLSPEVQNAIARGLAKEMGVDYDGSVRKVREGRILNPETRSATQDKIVKQGFEQMQKQLQLNKEVLDAKEKKLPPPVDLEARREKIAKDAQDFRATLFLATTALDPLIGSKKAREISTIGNALIDMNKTLKTFGPDGVTPDKLMMCTNFVTAGLMVAQLFMKQEDPTMSMLMGIMEQLKQMKEQLDRMEGKLDRLTDIVMDGFGEVLKGQHYDRVRLDQFRDTVLKRYAEDKQKEAIQTYLKYIAGDSVLTERAQDCASYLKSSDFDSISCLKEFARDVSREALFTSIIQPNPPRLMDLAWTNQMLSPTNLENPQIAIEQFSLPFFFAGSPQAMFKMVARNHEAVSSYANKNFGTPYTQLVNPEILTSELAIINEFFRQNRVAEREASLLIDQALTRAQEVERFLKATTQSEEFWVKVLGALEKDLKAYETEVRTLVESVTKKDYTNERKAILKPQLLNCVDNKSPIAMTTVVNNTNIDTWVPDIYWQAQEMGLGEVGACYEWEQVKNNRRDEGAMQFYRLKFRVKLFFNAQMSGDGKFVPGQKKNGNPVYHGGSTLIDSRAANTSFHHTTYSSGTYVSWSRAWSGGSMFLDVYETHNGVRRRGGGMGIGFPGGTPNQDLLQKRFVGAAVSELDANVLKAQSQKLSEYITSLLTDVVRGYSDAWFETSFDTERVTPPNTLMDRQIVKDKTFARLLAKYTEKYMFARNLLLISAYHGNSIGGCFSVLESYAPASLTGRIATNVLSGKSDSADFAEQSKGLKCAGGSVNEGLMKVGKRLYRARKAL